MPTVAVIMGDSKRSEERLKNESVAVPEEIDKVSMCYETVGNSGALRKVLFRVSQVAPTDATMLISAETGTGKELVALAIHRQSHRASHGFVSVPGLSPFVENPGIVALTKYLPFKELSLDAGLPRSTSPMAMRLDQGPPVN